jgi:hypothetical protein
LAGTPSTVRPSGRTTLTQFTLLLAFMCAQHADLCRAAWSQI